MNVPNWIIIVCIGAAIVLIAFFTIPETDYCTPNQIARYTNVIISHQECVIMPRCVIEPKDIRDFHYAKTNFSQCLIEHISEVQKKAEESTEE